jgi:hypothetical protein
MIGAIITPIIGATYLVWQIHKRDLRGWQHYACLTSLLVLISILFLADSGKVESFDVAGNNIRLVDQKLEEIKNLTEQNKQMSKATVKLAMLLIIPPVTANQTFIGTTKDTRPAQIELLKAAGLSDEEVQKFYETNK